MAWAFPMFTAVSNRSSAFNEGKDANMDGVTGYGDPTDGDVTSFASMAARIAGGTYSWLPGSRNEKLMPYYDRGVSDDDMIWMAANDAPESPPGMSSKPQKPPNDPLWEFARENRGKLSAD